MVVVTRQLSFFAAGAPTIASPEVTRHHLDDECWVDVGQGWLHGADALFDDLAAVLPWKRRSRVMWGEVVAEPRLTSSVPLDDPAVPPVVADIARNLSERYGDDLRHSWANWYRDGDDAVAWHADRIGRTQVNPLVVIVSLGGPRPFRMRPIGGGQSLRFDLASGDLLVMGGACQRRWQHCIPRQRGVGGRISLTLRATHD
jgi:alkylated DNA repair dioxygenase AlkB